MERSINFYHISGLSIYYVVYVALQYSILKVPHFKVLPDEDVYNLVKMCILRWYLFISYLGISLNSKEVLYRTLTEISIR